MYRNCKVATMLFNQFEKQGCFSAKLLEASMLLTVQFGVKIAKSKLRRLTMRQKMTWDEMKKAYPDEWLLITDYETDASGYMLSGIEGVSWI